MGGALMFDCQFQHKRQVHLHVADQDGRGSVITAYTIGSTDSHAADLRSGRESKGRLIQAADSRFAIELFLLNDRFGERPGEVVVLRLNPDGRARFEARSPGGQPRTLDFGSCSPAAGSS